MKLRIKYNNGLPTFNYESTGGKLRPIEVRVAGGKETQQDIDMVVNYLHHIGYVFKGVTNRSVPEIEELEIKNIPFSADIKQTQTSVEYGKNVLKVNNPVKDIDKYGTVIYDITSGVISETMYMTKNIGEVEQRIEHGTKYNNRYTSTDRGEEAVLDTAELFGNTLNMELMRQGRKDKINLLQMMAILEKYIPEYQLKWNAFTQKIQLTTSEGQVIGYDQLEEDDIYTFFKVYSLIIGKGNHSGVFMINAVSMSQDVLKAILAMIELTYKGEAVVFIYRANYISKTAVPRDEMVLPKYTKRK